MCRLKIRLYLSGNDANFRAFRRMTFYRKAFGRMPVVTRDYFRYMFNIFDKTTLLVYYRFYSQRLALFA